MKQSVTDFFEKFSGKLEGALIPWMYLDILGLVTIATGNLIDPVERALSLPFVWPDGRAATREEIAGEWQRVKGQPLLAKYGHIAAKAATRIRLSEQGARDLVQRTRDAFEAELVKRFPGFDDWPADAQLATMSMAWACGPHFNFPRLAQALKDRDFELAAKTCHINTDGPDRIPGTADDNRGVIPRNEANVIMYRNAAKVQAWKLDPNALCYPNELKELPAAASPPEEDKGAGEPEAPIVHAMPEFPPREISSEG